MKCRLKFIAAISMNAISTSSIATESKWPTLASYVENPPRPIAANAWQTASNQPIPAIRSEAMHAIVIRK
jgi:hypothetical protein